MERQKVQEQHAAHQNGNGQQLIAEEQPNNGVLRWHEKRYGVNQYGNSTDEEHGRTEPAQSATIPRGGQFSK